VRQDSRTCDEGGTKILRHRFDRDAIAISFRTRDAGEGWNAFSVDHGCTISLVSTGPQLAPPAAVPERNWLALAVAAAIVIAVAGGLVLIFEHRKSAPAVTPISASTDPYASSLSISQLAMSESSNLAGGKVTYLDGKITNEGSRTVSGITVQVLFRDVAHEVVQNETEALGRIRTRDPYVDLEPLSAAPLKSQETAEFRLIFDTVAQDWDGAYPEIRIIRVEQK
jgi:hypothetical protein